MSKHVPLTCACSRKTPLTCACDVPHYHLVTDEREEILATYNLCLLGPSEPYVPALVAAIVRAGVVETEENLTDLLPDGYRVVVKEWCSDE